MKLEMRLTSDNVIAQIAALCIAFAILAVPSSIPSQFVATAAGKAVSVAAIYLAAILVSPLTGAIFAILFVALMSENVEGLGGRPTTTRSSNVSKSREDSHDDSTPENFKKNHCKKVDGETKFVDAEGKAVSLKDMKDMFPNVSFNGDVCDPCENSCDFTVVERMTVEEDIRRKKEGRGAAVTRADRAKLST